MSQFSQFSSLGAAGFPQTIELEMDGSSPFINPLLEEPMLSRVTLADDPHGYMSSFQASPRQRGKRTASSRSSPSPSGRAKKSRPASHEAPAAAQPAKPRNFWDLPYPPPAMLPDSSPPSTHETYFPPANPDLDDEIDLELDLHRDVDMSNMGVGMDMDMAMDLDMPLSLEQDPDLEAHNAYLADNLSATGANPFAPGSQSPASHRSLSPFCERGGSVEAVATAATFGLSSNDMSDYEWMNRMNEGARARNSAFPRMDENLRMGRWEKYAIDSGGGLEEDGGRDVAGRYVKRGFRMTREQEDIVSQMVVESTTRGRYDSRR